MRIDKPMLWLLSLSGWLLPGTLSLFSVPGPASVEHAQGNYSTRLHTDAVERSTAETFLLTFTVDAPIEARLLSIEAKEPSQDGVRMIRLDRQPPRAIATDRMRHEVGFRVHPYLPGEIRIADFRARLQEGGEWIEVPFGTLRLTVSSLLEGDPESAEPADWVDFPEPESDPRASRGAWWIGLVAVLGGGVLVWGLLARRRKGKL